MFWIVRGSSLIDPRGKDAFGVQSLFYLYSVRALSFVSHKSWTFLCIHAVALFRITVYLPIPFRCHVILKNNFGCKSLVNAPGNRNTDQFLVTENSTIEEIL